MLIEFEDSNSGSYPVKTLTGLTGLVRLAVSNYVLPQPQPIVRGPSSQGYRHPGLYPEIVGVF